jgi:hypothetical protein
LRRRTGPNKTVVRSSYYAVATGRAERDPSGDLRGAIPPASGKHMATMTDPKEITGLLRSIDDYRGSIVTRCALQLALTGFCPAR